MILICRLKKIQEKKKAIKEKAEREKKAKANAGIVGYVSSIYKSSSEAVICIHTCMQLMLMCW